MSNTRQRLIIDGLLETKREGIADLIEWLEIGGFFLSPASTKYHGALKEGLVIHSLGVLKRLRTVNDKLKFVKPEEVVIASLLHDVCKMGRYLGAERPFKWNRDMEDGHAMLSLKRIEKFIKLTEMEEMIIRYHMGPYGTFEFLGIEKGEYSFQEMMSYWNKFKVVKVVYFCDEMSSMNEA